MAKIEITIKDDDGNVINEQELFHYHLDLKRERFTDIEDAVEEFKRLSSKEITSFILAHIQDKFVRKKKL
jgi:hypothetical protein